MYWLNDDSLHRRRPWVVLGMAVAIVWLIIQMRGSESTFISPWRASAAGEQPVQNSSGTLSGSFGAVDGLSVIGAPTISPAEIDAILASYGSPAVGTGQAMYDLGVQYGIDPIFCLAFFVHESTAGTKGVATVTKSVGNIRVTAGYEDYQGYRRYNTWEEGIEDWYRLIRELYIEGWQLTTVEQIIPVYAPPIENDTNHYVNIIRQLVTQWRTQ